MTVEPTPWPLPDVAAVGAILRARTQDDNDQELGTFTDVTRPTAAEVETLLKQAGTVVYGAIGDPAELVCAQADMIKDGIAYWISLLTAMLVELSYFPEQIDEDRSAYEHYKELWDNEISGFSGLVDAAAECRAGEVIPDDSTDGYRGCSFAFPVDAGGMVGWSTKW
jgi:hypothetical protein